MAERITHLRVVWEDHGHEPEPDWAYHLRMGDVDCDDAEVVRYEEVGWVSSLDDDGTFYPLSGEGEKWRRFDGDVPVYRRVEGDGNGE